MVPHAAFDFISCSIAVSSAPNSIVPSDLTLAFTLIGVIHHGPVDLIHALKRDSPGELVRGQRRLQPGKVVHRELAAERSFQELGRQQNPLAGANLYLSGIRNSKGTELIYFEIPMEKYLSYTPPK